MSTGELRDIPVTELLEAFDYTDIQAIDDYQTTLLDDRGLNPIERIIEHRFFPKSAEKTYGREELLGNLACNTAIFDDETESVIDSDKLASEILKAKDADQFNSDIYTKAFRVRRSVLAILRHADHNVSVVDISSTHNHSPSSAA
ncbi:hypothetical protein KC950_02270 [Candidatus Saccharibacteria bacterium]|nr:hypothetical protein [Candidatus Saccharibacteria bacterium]